MTKQLMKGFELMASQLMGNMARGVSSSFHHRETHKSIIYEDTYGWFYGFRHNNLYLNSLRNSQQSMSMEETKESPS